MKYKDLLELATKSENNLLLFTTGTGLITGPAYKQGIWVSRVIIQLWKEEGWID